VGIFAEGVGHIGGWVVVVGFGWLVCRLVVVRVEWYEGRCECG
jgi:hypothetical protein